MDRRAFFKSLLLTSGITPLLLASKKTAGDAELLLISETPHRLLPQLLDELQSLGLLSGQTYTTLNAMPQTGKLDRALTRAGWEQVIDGAQADMWLSSIRLQAEARPSFTLAGNGRAWDLRTRGLYSLWQEMNRRHPPSPLLTVASFKKTPPAPAAGKDITLYKDGRKVRTLSLKQKATKSFQTREGRITVRVEKGRAWIAESSCPHKICVNCPPVSFGGERIICAPSHFLLEVNGPSAVDTIIG
ncbi:MAG: NusG domain II-containing protein [Candidatus Aminicenantes bacterium]|jgi:hypothetical protein